MPHDGPPADRAIEDLESAYAALRIVVAKERALIDRRSFDAAVVDRYEEQLLAVLRAYPLGTRVAVLETLRHGIANQAGAL